MKEILRSLIPEAPDLQVLVVGNSNSIDNLKEVCEYLDEFGGHTDFISYSEIDFDIKNADLITVAKEGEKVEFSTRGYEALIILDVFEDMKHKKEFLVNYYHSLENSGNAFILIDREKYSPWDAKEELEEANFVAVNDIEIDEKYSLMYAKKMHGWGGGM